MSILKLGNKKEKSVPELVHILICQCVLQSVCQLSIPIDLYNFKVGIEMFKYIPGYDHICQTHILIGHREHIGVNLFKSTSRRSKAICSARFGTTKTRWC